MIGYGLSDDDSGKRVRTAQIGSAIAGILVGVAWWIYIDGAAYGVHVEDNQAAIDASGYSWIPGIITTIVFIMINAMPWHELNNTEDPGAQSKARLFLLVGMVMGVASVAVSVYIMVERFLGRDDAYDWTGASIFLSNLLIFVATFVMRFTTLPAEEPSMGVV